MNSYSFEVTLVSGLIGMDLDSTYGADSQEAFDYYFRNYGGTELLYDAAPCLKDDNHPLPENSSLIGLSWDPDMELFEGATPDYEIESVSGDQDSGWDYEYRLMLIFSAQISAESLEMAIETVRNEALKYLAIYDAGVDETAEIDEVRIVQQEK